MDEPRSYGLAAGYDGPPDYRVVGRRALFPEISHDEIERLSSLAQMNRHLAARLMPGVKAAYKASVESGLSEANGRAIAGRHEARKAMPDDPAFRTGSALRRATMKQRQQAGHWTVIRKRERLARMAAQATSDIASEDVGKEIIR